MNENIEAQLAEQGFYVSTTVGFSMWPMLYNRRDRVIIKPVGDCELKKTDLPLYRRKDGKYVLHRIIGVREDHYLIRGDNTYRIERVPKDFVIGVMTEFYRKGKHITADSKGYRFYARLWHVIYPIRALLYGIRILLVRIKHAVFPKKK